MTNSSSYLSRRGKKLLGLFQAMGSIGLLPEFGHLATTVHEGSKMRPKQCAKMVSDFDKISFCKSIGKPSAGDDTEASSYVQLKAALTAASPVHSTVGTVPSISVLPPRPLRNPGAVVPQKKEKRGAVQHLGVCLL